MGDSDFLPLSCRGSPTDFSSFSFFRLLLDEAKILVAIFRYLAADPRVAQDMSSKIGCETVTVERLLGSHTCLFRSEPSRNRGCPDIWSLTPLGMDIADPRTSKSGGAGVGLARVASSRSPTGSSQRSPFPAAGQSLFFSSVRESRPSALVETLEELCRERGVEYLTSDDCETAEDSETLAKMISRSTACVADMTNVLGHSDVYRVFHEIGIARGEPPARKIRLVNTAPDREMVLPGFLKGMIVPSYVP